MNSNQYFILYCTRQNCKRDNKHQVVPKKSMSRQHGKNLYLHNMLYSRRKILSLTEIVNGRMSVYVARYVRHHIFQTKHKPKRRPTKAKNKRS